MYSIHVSQILYMYVCSCGSVVENCVSSTKGCGFNSQGTRLQKKCITWILWIKASAKCINENVCLLKIYLSIYIYIYIYASDFSVLETISVNFSWSAVPSELNQIRMRYIKSKRIWRGAVSSASLAAIPLISGFLQSGCGSQAPGHQSIILLCSDQWSPVSMEPFSLWLRGRSH